MESTIINFRSSPWRFAFRGTYYFLSAKLAADSVMSFPEALFTFLFGVGLPSWDVYSDLIFALTLAIPRCYDYEGYRYYIKYHNWSQGNCKHFQCPETNKCIWKNWICNNHDSCGDGSDELHCNDYRDLKILSEAHPNNETLCIAAVGKFYGHPNFALVMLLPVLLTMLFILPHWWTNEKKTTSCNKIFTFALVLLQFYPQWKMLNVLYMGLWKKDAKWKDEKEKLQQNMGSLEPIIESVPQVHILLCLLGQNPKLITGLSNDDQTFFLVTFATSLISASKGIASFLLDGPCKLVPKNGLFGGLGTMGFIFLCLNIIATLIGKGFILAISLYQEFHGRGIKYFTLAIYWICFYLLPQLILALGLLIMSVGLKGTVKTIIKFPTIIMIPIFSIWTIGPVNPAKPCCCNSHQKLGVSICLTWINLILTFLSGLAYLCIFFDDFFDLNGWQIIMKLLIPSCSCLLIAMIFLILLQCLDKCPGCYGSCLPCCESYCYPVTQFTYLDVNNMDVIITQEEIDLEPGLNFDPYSEYGVYV